MEQPFKYTKAAIKLIIEDVKKIALAIKYISIIFTIAYFVFVIIVGIGNLYANIALASLFLIYAIFDLITYQSRKKNRRIRKNGRKVYRYIGLTIRAVAIGADIYGLIIATTIISPFALVAIVFSLIFWVANIILEIFIIIVDRRLSLLKESVNEDVENLTKPITDTKNFFRKLGNKEEIKSKEKSKYFLSFKKKVDEPVPEIEEKEEQNKNKPKKKTRIFEKK